MESINTQVILEVAESGSFKKAADKLGYTQAGIAYIVNTVEKEWNIKLFHREYGGVKITQEGKLLLPLIRQVNNTERQLAQKVGEINHMQAGLIRIVAFEVILIHWLPPVIAAFRKDFPNIDFEFVSYEDRFEAARMVYENDADIGFFCLPISKPLETVTLAEEPMMAIVSPKHPLAECEYFPVSEIENYPYIATVDDETSEIVELFESFGVKPKVSFTLQSDYSDMAFVNQNLGFSIFSRSAVQNTPFPLRAMEFDKPFSRTIALGVKSTASCSEIIKKFIEYTQNFIKSKQNHPL